MPKAEPTGPERGGPGERGLREVERLDRELLRLLARRADLLAGSVRPLKGGERLEPGLEKRLRAAFEAAGRELGLDLALVRKLFVLAGCVGRPKPAARPGAPGAFVLAPRSEPVQLDMQGPRSLACARLWVVLAAATGQAVSLSPLEPGDAVLDLVKAVNQAGGRLSREADALRAAMGEPADLDGATLFAGDQPGTLYALLALGLRGAGRCRLTGGQYLRLLDLAPAGRLLPQLGARLASLDRHSPGLPAALEFGGPAAERVELAPDVAPDLAACLAVMGFCLPGGLRLSFDPDGAHGPALAEAAAVLGQCGIAAEIDRGDCRVPPGTPSLPAAPCLPLDPELCAYLLALPALAGGAVRLAGPWPESGAAREIAAGLAAAGLALDIGATGISSKAGTKKPKARLEFGRRPALFPLALALGLALGEAEIALPGDAETAGFGRDMLDRLGVSCREQGGALILSPGRPSWSGTWTSPGPYFTLGLALAAFKAPGIAVDNPGSLAGLWPRFWTVYNALPSGRARPRPARREDSHAGARAGRRVLVRDDQGA